MLIETYMFVAVETGGQARLGHRMWELAIYGMLRGICKGEVRQIHWDRFWKRIEEIRLGRKAANRGGKVRKIVKISILEEF